jgi:hypothetical protein
VVLLLALALGMFQSALAGAPGWQVVASGLNNPRGLNFAADGHLYIAEAGSGGEAPCGPGPEGERCFGMSGSITRLNIKSGQQDRVVSELPSLAGEGGAAATGLHDISFLGRQGFAAFGFGGNPADRETNFGEAGKNFAQLARIGVKSGKWLFFKDLGAFEIMANPTGDEVDSNPYGLLALPGRMIVVDAGANDLLAVDKNGEVSVLATFPDRMVAAPPFLGLPPGTLIHMDTVPTSVALGPDGYFYVGQLTGFPFPVGGANIYRVPANGGAPEVFASGFTHIIDLAFGKDGSLYVVEIAKNGLLGAFGVGDWTDALIHVAKDGTRHEIAVDGLFAPGGVAVGKDGALYVANNSILSGAGEVLRIRP